MRRCWRLSRKSLISLIVMAMLSTSAMLSTNHVVFQLPSSSVFFDDEVAGDNDIHHFRDPQGSASDDDDDDDESSFTLVEKLLHNKLPTITLPQEGQFSPTVAEVRRTVWDRSLEFENGWKTELEQIVYLPINKNAHTRMVIAMDDLQNKEGVLQNATKQFIQLKVRPPKTANVTIRQVLDSHEQLQTTTSRAFTILRDPIDRYISGTCQEIIMRSKWPQCKSLMEKDALDWIGCIIRESVGRKSFAHHQMRQVDHLATVLRDHPNLPISVLSVDQATDFMIDLGVHERNDTKIMRHRRSKIYVASGGKVMFAPGGGGRVPSRYSNVDEQKSRVADFCALRAQDLRKEHLDTLCEAYKADVDLLRSANLEVPLCDSSP